MNKLIERKAKPLAMSTETVSDGDGLTLEQRVTALEKAFAKLALREHNNEFTRLGSPPQGVFAPASTLFDAPAETTFSEMERIEREIAYASARSDVEYICSPHTPLGPGVTWDTANLRLEATVEFDEGDAARLVNRALKFLDWIGCLDRDPANPRIVKIKGLP